MSAVLQSFPLGFQWPTVDPFLFCVHHVDLYGEGNEIQGPVASLEGRDLGQDFEGIDGWRMYHGAEVPGFPGHPHRGFETVTYVRRGVIDHHDSMGASARYGAGDVQWLTAGRGMVHSETFPLVFTHEANPLELFQIWLNLPAERKLVEPYFEMLWAEDIPRRTIGNGVEVTVIAGTLGDATAPAPPPDSWAASADSDVAIWHLRMDAGAECELPAAASDETLRTLYVFEGGPLTIVGDRDDEADEGDDVVRPSTGALVRGGRPLVLRADVATEVLVLQGRPIGEPVAQYGPFVMNDRAGIEQAFADYRRTGFGGWPWPTAEPVNSREQGRFARRPDGLVEEPAAR
jgi:quercetin 2,3-dioxygenase